MTVRDKDTLKAYFNDGDVPTELNYTDLIDSFLGFLTDSGRAWGVVVLMHSNGDQASCFPPNTFGRDDACAAAAFGDVVWVPPGSYAGELTIPDGVVVASMGNRTMFTDKIFFGGSSSGLKGITVNVTGSSSDPIIAIVGPPSGMLYLNDCQALVNNSGSGDAYSVQLRDGDITILVCNLTATTVSGNPLCVSVGADALGSAELYHCTLVCKKNGVDADPLKINAQYHPAGELRYLTESSMTDAWSYTNGTAATFAAPYYPADIHFKTDFVCPAGSTINIHDGMSLIYAGVYLYLNGVPVPGWSNHSMSARSLGGYGEDFPIAYPFDEIAIYNHYSLAYPYGTITIKSAAFFAPPSGIDIGVYACSMAVLSGKPLPGDRAVTDVIYHFPLHSNEFNMIRHHTAPTQFTTDAGKMDVLDPTGLFWQLSPYASHAPITLDTNTDTIFGLTGQQLTMDSQAINKILGSPASGAVGPLVIRSLVTNDLSDGMITLAKLANMATGSLIYRKTAGAGVPEINTLATLKTDLGLTGTNSGDQVKVSGAEIDAGIEDTKFATAKALSDSHNVPTVTPGSPGQVLTSNGLDWLSSAPEGGGHVIQEEGSDLPSRTNLNLIGPGITAVDNAGADATDITIVTQNNMYVDQSGGTGDTYGILAGDRNAVNVEFIVSQGEYISGTLAVYLNGQLLTQGSDEDWYEIVPASGIFHFVVAPIITDQISVVYGYLGISGSGGWSNIPPGLKVIMNTSFY